MTLISASGLVGGVLAHQVFRIFEPRHPMIHLLLLLVIPLALAQLLTTFPPPAPSRLRVLIDYLVGLVLSTIIYRLSPIHPLAKYPGPLLCRITQFREMFAAGSTKRGRWIVSMHEKYGPFVRTGEMLHVELDYTPTHHVR